MLAQFDQQKMNLSSQFISTNSALVEQHLDSAENLSVAFSVLDSMSNAVLSEAEQQLRSEESTEREAASLLNRTFHITAGMKNLSLILNEVNESVKTGQLTNTQARNAEKVYIHVHPLKFNGLVFYMYVYRVSFHSELV